MHGGNLIFDATQDAQSMNNTTVFDNNSIWIFEQIFQPLYTVTNNGKGVIGPTWPPASRCRLTEDLHVHAAARASSSPTASR